MMWDVVGFDGKEKSMSNPKNFVAQMSAEQKKLFDEKVRESAYGQSQMVSEWVYDELGIKTSKTAVARYEQELRKNDGIFDAGGSINTMAKVSVAGGELASLYQELGELEFRRAELLEKIRDLMS